MVTIEVDIIYKQTVRRTIIKTHTFNMVTTTGVFAGRD